MAVPVARALSSGQAFMAPEQRDLIEEAIRRDEKLLIRWLTKKLGDSDAARDVAQSVFMRVWAFAETSTVENPRALIFKAAGNLALNEIKRRNRFYQRHVTPSESAEKDALHNVASTAPSPETHASLREDVALILNAIHALPERPRQAFMMNRFDGLSYKEIAKTMGVSESSIEKYMIEALKQLRNVLNAERTKGEKIVTFPPIPDRRRKS